MSVEIWLVQWYKQYKIILELEVFQNFWKMMSWSLSSTVVQTVQNLLWLKSFVSFEICGIKFQWYNSTNSKKLGRSQKYGSFLKNISQTFNGTVVQTVQNKSTKVLFLPLYHWNLLSIWISWKMFSWILSSTVVRKAQNILWPESFVTFEICCNKFQWYNGTNSTKIVRSQNYGNLLENISQILMGQW